jgi:hypothetical protein
MKRISALRPPEVRATIDGVCGFARETLLTFFENTGFVAVIRPDTRTL